MLVGLPAWRKTEIQNMTVCISDFSIQVIKSSHHVVIALLVVLAIVLNFDRSIVKQTLQNT